MLLWRTLNHTSHLQSPEWYWKCIHIAFTSVIWDPVFVNICGGSEYRSNTNTNKSVFSTWQQNILLISNLNSFRFKSKRGNILSALFKLKNSWSVTAMLVHQATMHPNQITFLENVKVSQNRLSLPYYWLGCRSINVVKSITTPLSIRNRISECTHRSAFMKMAAFTCFQSRQAIFSQNKWLMNTLTATLRDLLESFCIALGHSSDWGVILKAYSFYWNVRLLCHFVCVAVRL